MANESWLNKTIRETGQGLLHWDEARRKKAALDEIKAVEARIAAKETAASAVPETPTERDNIFEARRKKIERMTK